jgi:hypothetical protein
VQDRSSLRLQPRLERGFFIARRHVLPTTLTSQDGKEYRQDSPERANENRVRIDCRLAACYLMAFLFY